MPGPADQDDLDRLVRRADPDRWLGSRFIADPAARADVIALLAYDQELARAPKAASNTLLAEIRLTWWREVLDQVFAGGPVRRHPGGEALARAARARDLPREPLEAMIDARIEALDTASMGAAGALRWADRTAGSVARLAVAILDPAAPTDAAAPAGRAWGLALLRRSGQASREVVDPLLAEALGEARAAAATLSVAAFPAVLHVRLARFDLAGREPGPLARRRALFVASATGRI